MISGSPISFTLKLNVSNEYPLLRLHLTVTHCLLTVFASSCICVSAFFSKNEPKCPVGLSLQKLECITHIICTLYLADHSISL